MLRSIAAATLDRVASLFALAACVAAACSCAVREKAPGVVALSRTPAADRARTTHVYPAYGREHATDGTDCWCTPVVQQQTSGGAVVVHREDN